MLWFNAACGPNGLVSALVPKLIGRQKLVLAIFVAGIALLGLMFKITPTGFLPNEDQSLLYVLVTLPIQASIDQTTAAS